MIRSSLIEERSPSQSKEWERLERWSKHRSFEEIVIQVYHGLPGLPRPATIHLLHKLPILHIACSAYMLHLACYLNPYSIYHIAFALLRIPVWSGVLAWAFVASQHPHLSWPKDQHTHTRQIHPMLTSEKNWVGTADLQRCTPCDSNKLLRSLTHYYILMCFVRSFF